MRVILAAPGIRTEAGLVAAAASAGVQVVRRPVDAADLLAVASMEPSTPVIVGVDLPRMSLDVITRLDPARRSVIGVFDTSHQREKLRAFGVVNLLECQTDPAETVAQIAGLLIPGEEEQSPTDDTSPDTDLWEHLVPTGQGKLIAVWGPPGAPGRSTVTIELAAELARKRQRTCIIDADTYAPALAMRLGVLDDVSGLIVACRHADNGSLTTRTLLSATRLIDDRWYLLTGLGRSERWPDLRPAALERLWASCRSTFDTTVIDLGSCLEASQMPMTGLGMERNAAARGAAVRADGVVVVTRPDALSVTRLLNALPQMHDLVGDTPMRVVITHVERRDRRPTKLRDLLLQAGFDLPVTEIALDTRAYSQALNRGTTTRQVAPMARSRRAVRELARALIEGWPRDGQRDRPVRQAAVA